MLDRLVRGFGEIGLRRADGLQLRVDRHRREVLRELDVGRAGLLELRDAECLSNDLRHRAGEFDTLVPLGHRLQHAHDVDELVRFLVELVEARLTGERDHRRVIEEGVGDTGHEVGSARSERRHRDGRTAGEAAIDVGHERGALFVTGGDVAHRLLATQRVEDVHRLFAGHREDVFAALDREAVHEQAGGRPGGGSGHAWQSTGRILGG